MSAQASQGSASDEAPGVSDKVGITVAVWSSALLLLGALVWSDLKWWSVLSLLPAIGSKKLFVLGTAGLLLAAFLRTRSQSLLIAFLSLPLFLIICSDWTHSDYSFLLGPDIRGEIMLGAILFLLTKRAKPALFAFLLIYAVAGALFNYLYIADSRLLFSDDHPAFLQRLIQLKEHFPSIPIYDTNWNAGVDSLYLFASGALTPFFLFAPLIYATPLLEFYTLIPILITSVVLPVSLFLSMRLLGGSVLSASIAAILSLSAHSAWFLWCFSYGTMGFCSTAALIPLSLCLYFLLEKRALENGNFNPGTTLLLAAAFILVTSLCLFWPLMGIVLIPFILLTLSSPRRFIANKPLLFSSILLTVLHLPWMAVFAKDAALPHMSGSEKPAASQALAAASEPCRRDSVNAESQLSACNNSSALVSETRTPPNSTAAVRVSETSTAAETTERVWVTARGPAEILEDARSGLNPLLWLLAVPGIVLLPVGFRLRFGLSFAGLVVVSCFLPVYIPKLELDRFFLVLALLGTLPAALCFERIISVSARSRPLRILAALLCGLLLAGARSSIEYSGGRRITSFRFAGQELEAFVEALKNSEGTAEQETPGRIFFSGFVLHDLEGGHLAPLTELVDRPMIASSHVHNKWKPEDAVPGWALERGDVGVEAYLDLMNVSTVVAHERRWILNISRILRDTGNSGEGKKFRLYSRDNYNRDNYNPERNSASHSLRGYFLEGEGNNHRAEQPGACSPAQFGRCCPEIQLL